MNDYWSLQFELGTLPHRGRIIARWREVTLRYDHGEIRCFHASTASDQGDFIVHGGLSQEFDLQGRLQLNYHPDSVRSLLLLRVPISPVKSLLRLSLDACVLHFERLVSGPGVSLGDLPARLRATLESRHIYESLGRDPNFGDPDNPPSEEDPFDREMLHSGI